MAGIIPVIFIMKSLTKFNYTDLVKKVSALVGGNEYSVLYGYNNRRLSSITHNGFDYGFTYDGMGRIKDVKIADTVYSSNAYTLTDTTTVTTTYATGEKMTVETDRHQQPIKKIYTGKNGDQTVISTAEYDSLGKIVKMVDNCEDIEYNYKYDGFDNVIEETHRTVVVYLVRPFTTPGTDTLFPRLFYLYFKTVFIFTDIFYLYLLYSNQFFRII